MLKNISSFYFLELSGIWFYDYFLRLVFCFTEIRELFRLFDTNNDRSISATELGKAMRFLGMSPSQQEVADAMKALDINGRSRDWCYNLGVPVC